MSLLGATILTAIATAVLAVGAIVTAILAYAAFRKQSREVRAIERQVTDGQELTRQQAKLLEVQTGQLEVLREQLEDQRRASAKQAEVLELQAAELRESLAQRKREAEQRHRDKASRVFISQEAGPVFATTQAGADRGQTGGPSITAHVVNSSDQPVYDVQLRWHHGPGRYSDPEPLGTIMPGGDITRTEVFPPGTNTDLSGADIWFTDAAGARWLRRPDGYLAEQP
jgi:hypothetical protein